MPKQPAKGITGVEGVVDVLPSEMCPQEELLLSQVRGGDA